MNREELAWAAGFFDGEGCTSTTSRGYPLLAIGQNFREPLDRFREAVGGFGRVRECGEGGARFEWRCSRWQQVRVIHALLWPYLCGPKRAQANAVWDQFDAKRAANPKVGQGSGRHKARVITGRESA